MHYELRKREIVRGFNATLSALRRETGRSQRQVASDLSVSQALLSHYENGAREPKLEFVVRACEYYGVTTDYILGRSDERGAVPTALIDTIKGLAGEFQDLKAAGDALIEKLKKFAIFDDKLPLAEMSGDGKKNEE